MGTVSPFFSVGLPGSSKVIPTPTIWPRRVLGPGVLPVDCQRSGSDQWWGEELPMSGDVRVFLGKMWSRIYTSTMLICIPIRRFLKLMNEHLSHQFFAGHPRWIMFLPEKYTGTAHCLSIWDTLMVSEHGSLSGQLVNTKGHGPWWWVGSCAPRLPPIDKIL